MFYPFITSYAINYTNVNSSLKKTFAIDENIMEDAKVHFDEKESQIIKKKKKRILNLKRTILE